MKPIIDRCHVFLLAVPLIVALAAGCSDDSVGQVQPQITGSLVAHSDCGGYSAARDVASIPTDQSAIVWQWDGKGTLGLRHLNAGFNCCPEIGCEVTAEGSTITVTEQDRGMCDCLCLYDADFEVSRLTPGIYNIKIVEPYLVEGDEKLEFEIMLSLLPAVDTVFVSRDHYPWMPDAVPEGSFVAFSTCGGFESPLLDTSPPLDSNCLVWHQDQEGTLWIRDSRRCCGCSLYEVTAEIAVQKGFITVVEHMRSLLSCCSCPFDIDMKIENLPSDIYFTEFVCMLAVGDTTGFAVDTLRFWLDLTGTSSGYVCLHPTCDSTSYPKMNIKP